MHYNHPRALGFTLIELIIVIVLIAIISAVGVLHYSDIATDTQDAALKANLASYTQGLAQMHGQYMIDGNDLGMPWSNNYPDMRYNTNSGACPIIWAAISTQPLYNTAWIGPEPIVNTGDIVGTQSNGGTGTGFCMFTYTPHDHMTVSEVQNGLGFGTGIIFVYAFNGQMWLFTDGWTGYYANYSAIFGQ